MDEKVFVNLSGKVSEVFQPRNVSQGRNGDGERCQALLAVN